MSDMVKRQGKQPQRFNPKPKSQHPKSTPQKKNSSALYHHEDKRTIKVFAKSYKNRVRAKQNAQIPKYQGISLIFGGDNRIRTCDLSHVRRAL